MTPAIIGEPGFIAVARSVHRLSASLVLVLSIGLCWLTLSRRPRLREAGALALALTILAVLLAALGIITPGATSVWILLSNLLGGMLMLAIAWKLHLLLRSNRGPAATKHSAHAPRDAKSPDDGTLARWALIALLLWAIQAALGAVSGASLLAIAGAIHLSFALVAAPVGIGVGALASRHGRHVEGAVLAAISVFQVIFGLTTAYFAGAPQLVLLHNIGAAIGIALLGGMTGLRALRAPQRAS